MYSACRLFTSLNPYIEIEKDFPTVQQVLLQHTITLRNCKSLHESWSQNKHTMQSLYFRFFTFTFTKNSSGSNELLRHNISVVPTKLRFVPHRGTSSSAPFWYQPLSLCYKPPCQNCFHSRSPLNSQSPRFFFGARNRWQSQGTKSKLYVRCSKVRNRIIRYVNVLPNLPPYKGLMIVILSCGMYCERHFLVQMTCVNTWRMLRCVVALPFLTPPLSLILSNSTESRDINVPSEYFRVANKSWLTQQEPDWY